MFFSAPSLFKKDIEPRCEYCAKGKASDAETILCTKKGIMSPGGSCTAFKYDPMKRVPPRPVVPDFSKLKDEDFSL